MQSVGLDVLAMWKLEAAMLESKERLLGNDQIRDYLGFYVRKNKAPGFAVLLNAPWGAGKTWFVNRFREQTSDQKFIYVSLYGVTSTTQVEDQFFQQLHPVLASKPFTIGAKLLRGTLKAALKIDFDGDKKDDASLNLSIPDLSVQDFLKNSEDCVLIFDDLERCPNLHEMLGYINHFVEHQGQKVILLGHEGAILNQPDYKERKEKLVGRSFTLTPETENALNSFISELTNEDVQKILKQNLDSILQIFEKANHSNLRSLKQAVIEYDRFHSQLPSQTKSHRDFQAGCIRSVFSVCVELKAGRVDVEDIKDFAGDYFTQLVKFTRDKEKTESNEEKKFNLLETYFNGNREDVAPNEESLYFFFKHGCVPKTVMDEAVAANRYFLEESTPTWMKLWHVYGLSNDEFERFSGEVFSNFENYLFTKDGEFKHVAAMMLSFAELRLIKPSYSDTVSKVRAVLQHMISHQLLEPLSEDLERWPRIDDSYAGLGYSNPKDQNFQNLCGILQKYQEQLKTEKIRAFAAQLIPMLKSDSRRFYKVLTSSGNERPALYRMPVLQYVPSEDFVTAMIEMNPANNSRLDIGYTFKERYSLISSYPKLAEELPWLKQVSSKIEKIAITHRQPTRFHLEQLNKNYVSKAIQDIESWDQERKKTSQAD